VKDHNLSAAAQGKNPPSEEEERNCFLHPDVQECKEGRRAHKKQPRTERQNEEEEEDSTKLHTISSLSAALCTTSASS
jgi:hypothetical protein